MKDPNDKHHLIIDYEVAEVVKEIFIKASIGMSSYQIASYLKDKKILKPRAYMNLKYQRYSNQINDKYPYDWKSTTIKRIVENYEYCGHMVSNRNTK
ncbi:MAG: recombinase family protein [Anaeroplasma sp.]